MVKIIKVDKIMSDEAIAAITEWLEEAGRVCDAEAPEDNAEHIGAGSAQDPQADGGLTGVAAKNAEEEAMAQEAQAEELR